MDLTRIEALARNVLEQEAESRGISKPGQRSRGELIRLIVRHDYKHVRSLRDARNVVGHAVLSAASALPVPLSALERLRERLSLPAKAAPARKTDAKPERVQVSGLARPPASARAAEPAEAVLMTPAALRPTPLPPAMSPSAAGAHEHDGSPNTRSFVEEPIRTHSMARLLAVQGHRERALAIYEELLAKNNADVRMADEASALRHGQPLTFAPGELPLPPSNAERRELLALGDAGDKIECQARGEGTLCVRWSISAAGLERARMVLGSDGELAVRVVSIKPDPARVVRSEITEHGPISVDGEWTTQPGAAAARAFAAVGLRDAQRFVSIAHARAE